MVEVDKRMITSKIVDLLERKGPQSLENIHKALKKEIGELSRNELNRALMRMEIHGLVRVYRIPRGKHRVELA
ncbi:MAG TPA: hypothetical protein ENF19_03510 [Candidatus Bathyarchaeota archaeon]|nr:hypothetical protein [Candidatus Bathyarchaeota archaeon]